MPSVIDEHTQWVGSDGKPIVNGLLYIGSRNNDPKLNLITIYSDRALSTVIANPQTLDADGRSTNKVWVPGRYSVKVEDENNVEKYLELDAGEEAGIQTISLSNVQGTNAVTAEASPTITSYTDKTEYIWRVGSANTTDEVTISIDGLTVVPFKRNLDQPIGKGKLKVDDLIVMVYNETANVFNWTNENTRVMFKTKGADIASAATVDLATATGNRIDVTGAGGPITGLGSMLAGLEFDLKFPGTGPITITSSSVASPTNILTAAVHGLTTGEEVIIDSHTGSVPDINGRHTVTVINTTNFTIPVNVTTGGTGGNMRGVPKMTHSATLQLLGDQDLELLPDDLVSVMSLTPGTWQAKSVTRADGGLAVIASQAQAEAKTNVDNTLPMTALRTRQSIIGDRQVTPLATATASTSASLDFDAGIDFTAFDSYVFELLDLNPTTDNVLVTIRTSTDGGSTYDSGAGNYIYAYQGIGTGGSGLRQSTSDTAISIGASATLNWGFNSSESVGGTIILRNPSNATKDTRIEFHLTGESTDGNVATAIGGGRRASTGDVDGIQFFFSSGNIVSGTINLYGVKYNP